MTTTFGELLQGEFFRLKSCQDKGHQEYDFYMKISDKSFVRIPNRFVVSPVYNLTWVFVDSTEVIRVNKEEFLKRAKFVVEKTTYDWE